MRIDFRAPARLDDALDVSVALRQCRHASLVIAQDIRCDGRLLLDAEVKVAALDADGFRPRGIPERSEEHTSELQSLMRISYAVFCLKKKPNTKQAQHYNYQYHRTPSPTTR